MSSAPPKAGELVFPETGRVYQIYSFARTGYVELEDGSSVNGTRLQTSDERFGEPSFRQLWFLTLNGSGEDAFWTMQNLQSGTFIDLENDKSANGTTISGQAQDLSALSQRWIINAVQYKGLSDATVGKVTAFSGYTIQNSDTKTAMDAGRKDERVWNWAYGDGNEGNINQLFRFVPKSLVS